MSGVNWGTQSVFSDSGDARPQKRPSCRWCSTPAYHEVEIEPQRTRTDPRTNTREIIPALVAPACGDCKKRLERAAARTLAEKQAEKARRKTEARK